MDDQAINDDNSDQSSRLTEKYLETVRSLNLRLGAAESRKHTLLDLITSLQNTLANLRTECKSTTAQSLPSAATAGKKASSNSSRKKRGGCLLQRQPLLPLSRTVAATEAAALRAWSPSRWKLSRFLLPLPSLLL